MEIFTKQIELIELKPAQGKWLTQKDIADNERIFSQHVFLAENDSSDNWEEWSDVQKSTFEQNVQKRYM